MTVLEDSRGDLVGTLDLSRQSLGIPSGIDGGEEESGNARPHPEGNVALRRHEAWGGPRFLADGLHEAALEHV